MNQGTLKAYQGVNLLPPQVLKVLPLRSGSTAASKSTEPSPESSRGGSEFFLLRPSCFHRLDKLRPNLELLLNHSDSFTAKTQNPTDSTIGTRIRKPMIAGLLSNGVDMSFLTRPFLSQFGATKPKPMSPGCKRGRLNI